MSTKGVIIAVLSFYISACLHAQENIQWHKQLNDSTAGINSDAALQWLNAHHRKPESTIIIGYIDTGLDTRNRDIESALWRNPKEKQDGKDNDRNGYVDDIHGWNFLGNSDGTLNLSSVGTEEYREFKRLYPKYQSVGENGEMAVRDTSEYAYYLKMRKMANIDRYLDYYHSLKIKEKAYGIINKIIRENYPDISTVTVQQLMEINSSDEDYYKACQIIAADVMQAGRTNLVSQLEEQLQKKIRLAENRLRSIVTEKDKRLLLGDDVKNPNDRSYGNPQLSFGQEYDHAMFGMGLIAAQGTTDKRFTGIYPSAKLMVVRSIPDNGDEYDKDVASAIFYAVNNGAKIINISSAKTCSPDSGMVQQAIEYAAKHDVLIVLAAGNKSLNADEVPVYPKVIADNGKHFGNVIRVGASAIDGTPSPFTNYGRQSVDLFAPGQKLWSYDKDGTSLKTESGTSFAAPIVTATAAMIRAYFPKLSAAQVRDILIRSVTPVNKEVLLPGSKTEKTNFSQLSIAGGILNALNAVKLAAKTK